MRLPNAPGVKLGTPDHDPWTPDPFTSGVAAESFVVTGETDLQNTLTGTIFVRGRSKPVGQFRGSSGQATFPLASSGDAVWVESDAVVSGGIELNLINSAGTSVVHRVVHCCADQQNGGVAFPSTTATHAGWVILDSGGDLVSLAPAAR